MPGFLSPFGCQHLLLGSSFPAGGLGLPCGWLTGRCPDPIGVPRSAHTSYDRVGRPLDPGDGDAHTADICSSAAACRFPTATSLHPGATSTTRGSR